MSKVYTRRFKCPHCGCILLATEDEKESNVLKSHFSEMFYTEIDGSAPGFFQSSRKSNLCYGKEVDSFVLEKELKWS